MRWCTRHQVRYESSFTYLQRRNLSSGKARVRILPILRKKNVLILPHRNLYINYIFNLIINSNLIINFILLKLKPCSV